MEDLPHARPRMGHSRTESSASQRASQILEAAQPASRDFAIGLLLLLVVVFMWTLSMFAVQVIIEEGYDKPFFLTYLSTSSFILYLAPALWRRSRSEPERAVDGPHRLNRLSATQPLLGRPVEENEVEPEILDNSLESPLTVRETAKLAFVLCFFWFSTVWLVSIALKYTSVGSATVLSNTTGVITMALSRFAAIEKLTKYKVAAVLISLGGISLVSLSDSDSDSSTPTSDSSNKNHPFALLGDFLALFSSVFYALYVIAMKLKVGSEARIDMQLFFGFVGLYDIVLYWIPGIALHYLEVETLVIPQSKTVILYILLNNLLTVISNYLYAMALLKTTPLVATVGGTLSVPLAVLGDVLRGRPAKFSVFVGATLVVISPIMVALSENEVRKKDDFWNEAAIQRRKSRPVSIIRPLESSI